MGEAEGGKGQNVEADQEALVVAQVHGAGDGGGPDLRRERGADLEDVEGEVVLVEGGIVVVEGPAGVVMGDGSTVIS